MASKPYTTPAVRPHQSRLSRVMRLAWALFRDETNERSFGEVLASAWRIVCRLIAPTPKMRALRSGGASC